MSDLAPYAGVIRLALIIAAALLTYAGLRRLVTTGKRLERADALEKQVDDQKSIAEDGEAFDAADPLGPASLRDDG